MKRKSNKKVGSLSRRLTQYRFANQTITQLRNQLTLTNNHTMINSKQLTYSKQRLIASSLRHAKRSLCITLLLLALPAQASELNQLQQVTPNFPSFTFLNDAEVTSDGKTAVYLADAVINGRAELFSVPVTGGESILLNPPLDGAEFSNRQVRAPILIEPSGEHLIYRLDLSVEDEFEIFRVPTSGGNSTRLGTGDTGFRPRLTPDGKLLVFTSDQRREDVFELFSVPVDGSVDAARSLHPPLIDNQDIFDLRISPDSQTVIYQVETEVRRFVRREELFFANVDGSDANTFRALVQDYPSDTGDINDFDITPDGASVVYLSDQRIDSTQELFKVATSGGTAVRLSSDVLSSPRVREFKISSNGDRVLYTANTTANDVDTLFFVPVNGSSDDVQAIETELDQNDVVNFVISGDGRNVISEKLIDIDQTIQLFITPIGGQQTSVAFSPVFGDPEDNEEGQLLKLSGNGTQLSYIPPDGRRAFAATVALPTRNDGDELCLPIKLQNGKVVVVCL